MAVDWNYYDKFKIFNKKYLPIQGEGNTKATQIVTAVNRLVYKWYNDGDVFDNTYLLDGWGNDLSSYANWLYQNTTKTAQIILDTICNCYSNDEYEDLLQKLTNELFTGAYLEEQNKIGKVDTIYEYDGKFKFIEPEENYFY